eukprot:CAMPEP_0198258582 /NCGR_PEP_ID=MMETSP1447-20131203/7962_1 /TAXON_ID=420782 /ORGANISM="Chaetoceros dichaeta, Strain CCMP1751" /LENGTH=286 /DNA_ID=CAMNT_0043945733 /DNA_START=104 /DNA_END=964 /DNA_ORIENTATION=-
MSNVHGLFSSNNNNSSNSDDEDPPRDENNRYVGGVSARGGGSGLAVTPNPDHASILDNIHATASAPESSDAPIERRITMYRSGFIIDDGPYRRLDDPANSEFLRSLARGMTPQELRDVGGEGGAAAGGAGVVVGLEDKRGMEYEDDTDRNGTGGASGGGGGGGSDGFQSFSGAGQSLTSDDAKQPAAAAGTSGVTSSSSSAAPPAIDESKPTTLIQIRLLNGKRLKVKVNCDSPVSVLPQHINASGDGGEADYVLSSGYPPRILDDLEVSVEEAGLKGAQVIQKKA